MKNTLLVLSVASIALAAGGCSPEQRFASKAAVRAADRISASFGTRDTQSAGLQVDQGKVLIQESALEKEFLLQANLTTQDMAPQFNGLRSRVVAFRKRGGSVYLMEATQGHTVEPGVPTNLLLAEFPILSQTGGWLELDFNQGMSRLFVAGDWHAGDAEGTAYAGDYTAVKAEVSYLDSVRLTEDNRLLVRQVARLEGGTPVEVRYELKPYRPTEGFEAVRSPGFDHMGFFEVAPQIDPATDAAVTYATKWDLRQPVTYAVSANTPADFKQAVKDGILYWNQVFGSERVKVVDAPAGVTAPDSDYNVVQWLDFNSAGFAYADAQMDPRDGQITHAQIFMTSVFAIGGMAKARALLQRLSDVAAAPAPARMLALRGFEREPMCAYSPNGAFAQSVAALVKADATDAQILKVAQDYVREVVSHEVGHTLGMRHNFAGSLGANYALADRASIVEKYLRDGRAPDGVRTSSSVMEYQVFEEGALTGDLISRKEPGNEYDIKAMAFLYDGKKFKNSEIPFFCTDTLESKLLDCHTFDLGHDPVEYAAWSVRNDLDTLPNKLMEAFIRAKSPAIGVDPVALEQVALSPDVVAASILAPRSNLLATLTPQGQLISVRRALDLSPALYEKEIRDAEIAKIADSVQARGGWNALLALDYDAETQKALTQFLALTQDARYLTGVGPSGQPYSFDSDDVAKIQRAGRTFFSKFRDSLVKADVALLTAAKPLADVGLSDDAEPVLETVERGLVLSTLEGQTQDVEITVPKKPAPTDAAEPTTEKIMVHLPAYAYPVAVRAAAVKLLDPARSPSTGWGAASQARLKKANDDAIKAALSGRSISELDQSLLPKGVLKWVLEQRQVATAFLQ
ncbi:MAG TPA: zinc-dependent metalloprotease [Bdellovibrionota bacterium]|nr:zinc-dependent metalloprotease [Bdellovibrionota bacterium]